MSRKVFGWRRSVWWWVAVMEVAVALAALPPSRSFNIGGVLHDNLTQSHFTHALRLINFDGVSVADQTTLYEETTVLRGGPLTTALHVCSSLISRAVFAVVVASPHGLSGTTAAVSYTCGFFHIPVICTHSRDSAFSNKNIHASLLRTVPPYSHQADVWVALMQSFQYRQAILLHSANADGRALRDRFQALARRYTDPEDAVKLAMVVEFRAGQESFVEELGGIRNHLVKVILLYANESDADGIFHDAGYLNLTVDGYVWVVGEQALHSPHAPVGTLALQLKYAHDYSAHITDSLRVVALALRQLHETQAAIPSPPVSCDAEDAWDLTGQTLFRLIREQVLTDGQTGKVAFDEHGDRTNAEYTLLNIQEQLDGNHTTTTLQPVGEFRYSKVSEQMELVVNSSSIVWPGGSTLTPSGYALPKHLKVLTMRETPFVYARTVAGEDCSGRNEVFCPHINDTSLEVGLACCWGYCVDLLLHLASNNDFTFDLFLYPEAQYGHLQQGPHGKEWTGVMGRLVRDVEGEQGMDMVMAPLTITPDRAQHIHFTKPYKYHGITILIKRTVVMPALVSILQPFHGTLWLLLLATVHIIAFFIWLLDRLSPVYKQEGDDTDSLVLSESFWFSWSVILNSGLTDGTPRCMSGRVLGIAWAGFAMIMAASYTANLAAFLVLDKPITAISGINDPRLRNPVENFTFATVRDSAVDMFFKRKTEWSSMYRVMETHSFTTVDEAVQAVRTGSLQAFIWESSRLEYEASQDCDLVTVGELFGRSGYGIGLRQGSPWADNITLDILELHENGYMESLDKTWIWNQVEKCSGDRNDEVYSKQLGLRNLEGIFIMIVGGILSGIILVLVEIIYDRYLGNTGRGGGQSSQEARDNHPHQDDDDSVEDDKQLGSEDGDSSAAYMEDTLESAGGSHHSMGRTYVHGNRTREILRIKDKYIWRVGNIDKDKNEAILQEIDERLRTSPHIPEEWKTRVPLEWCQRYLDILNAEQRQGAHDDAALITDFHEFESEASDSAEPCMGERVPHEECGGNCVTKNTSNSLSPSSPSLPTPASNTLINQAAPFPATGQKSPVTQNSAPLLKAPLSQTPITQSPVLSPQESPSQSRPSQVPSQKPISHIQPSKAPPSQVPPSQAPSQKPISHVRPSQAPPSQAPPSQVPPSQAPPSQAPPSQAPPSQAPPSQVPPSQAPPSQAPPSQAPSTVT